MTTTKARETFGLRADTCLGLSHHVGPRGDSAYADKHSGEADILVRFARSVAARTVAHIPPHPRLGEPVPGVDWDAEREVSTRFARNLVGLLDALQARELLCRDVEQWSVRRTLANLQAKTYTLSDPVPKDIIAVCHEAHSPPDTVVAIVVRPGPMRRAPPCRHCLTLQGVAALLQRDNFRNPPVEQQMVRFGRCKDSVGTAYRLGLHVPAGRAGAGAGAGPGPEPDPHSHLPPPDVDVHLDWDADPGLHHSSVFCGLGSEERPATGMLYFHRISVRVRLVSALVRMWGTCPLPLQSVGTLRVAVMAHRAKATDPCRVVLLAVRPESRVASIIADALHASGMKVPSGAPEVTASHRWRTLNRHMRLCDFADLTFDDVLMDGLVLGIGRPGPTK